MRIYHQLHDHLHRLGDVHSDQHRGSVCLLEDKLQVQDNFGGSFRYMWRRMVGVDLEQAPTVSTKQQSRRVRSHTSILLKSKSKAQVGGYR